MVQNMKKKVLTRVLAGTMAVMVTATSLGMADVVWAEKTAATETATADIKRVCVHDPSIVKDETTGTYYVFGSHQATAKSDDLVNWTQMAKDTFKPDEQNSIYGNVVESLADSFKWAGYDDGDCAGGGLAVWAPDVVWDAEYEWEDGTKGAYLLYYSASSTWKRSCIGLAVSKTIEGPYTGVDTLVYSGMTSGNGTDGNSQRDTKWDNDYLNFKELIAKGSANGGIDGVSEAWFAEDGSYNIANCPNCIDPCIIESTDGKMYMTYGSWSGGLFLLEIDKKTGLAVYPGKDGTDEVSGNRVDRYYGIHIAGGNPTGTNTASGEGPFITYDAETGYYYLYETYGGLAWNGGYNMRLFRSKNVTGPYVDAAGNEAQNNSTDTYKYGIKLIGNYAFYNQRSYNAAGHNSALVDTDGARYLISHQRLDCTDVHEVRVRQQFVNEDGWPVTAVYENRNETIANYTDEAVAGSYEFINHGNAEKDGSMLATKLVTLNADGTVSGEETGTWKRTDSTKGYDYVTLTIGDAVYKGVFFEQTSDLGRKVMTFTAIGNNNESVWGSAFDMSNADDMLGRSVANTSLPSYTTADLALRTDDNGVKITWKSDNAEVISDDGKVTRPDKDTVVTLTASFEYNGKTQTKDYKVNVYENAQKAKLVYGYDFSTVKKKKVSAVKSSSGTKKAVLNGSAKIVKDSSRGKVLKVTNKEGAKGESYLKLPADTMAEMTSSGYSVSMWVKADKSTFEHSALFEADSNNAYPMTRIGVNLIARINTGTNSDSWSDAIPEETGSRGKWQLVTYTVNTEGICVYLNGKLIKEDRKDLAICFDSTSASCIQKADNIMVGAGFIWGDEDVRNVKFDDVRVYSGTLTQKQVKSIYSKTK